jgi:hypothetical protein
MESGPLLFPSRTANRGDNLGRAHPFSGSALGLIPPESCLQKKVSSLVEYSRDIVFLLNHPLETCRCLDTLLDIYLVCIDRGRGQGRLKPRYIHMYWVFSFIHPPTGLDRR